MRLPNPGLLKRAKQVVREARERQKRIIDWLAPRAAEYIRDGQFIDELKTLADYYRDTGESVTLDELRSANVITRGTYYVLIPGASSKELRTLIDDAWRAIEDARNSSPSIKMENTQLALFTGEGL